MCILGHNMTADVGLFTDIFTTSGRVNRRHRFVDNEWTFQSLSSAVSVQQCTSVSVCLSIACSVLIIFNRILCVNGIQIPVTLNYYSQLFLFWLSNSSPCSRTYSNHHRGSHRTSCGGCTHCAHNGCPLSPGGVLQVEVSQLACLYMNVPVCLWLAGWLAGYCLFVLGLLQAFPFSFCLLRKSFVYLNLSVGAGTPQVQL